MGVGLVISWRYDSHYVLNLWVHSNTQNGASSQRSNGRPTSSFTEKSREANCGRSTLDRKAEVRVLQQDDFSPISLCILLLEPPRHDSNSDHHQHIASIVLLANILSRNKSCTYTMHVAKPGI